MTRRTYREKLFSPDPEERYAMQFALALLMPRRAVIPFVRQHGSDPIRMAHTFGVPVEAAELRLATLPGPLPWQRNPFLWLRRKR